MTNFGKSISQLMLVVKPEPEPEEGTRLLHGGDLALDISGAEVKPKASFKSSITPR